jgi:mono/diheme cytochrome c family protein
MAHKGNCAYTSPVKRLLPFLLLGFSALAQGAEGLWARYCAQCHGEKAQGARPYPGLGEAASLLATPEGRRYLVL